MVEYPAFPRSLNSWAWTPAAKRFSIINTRPWVVTLHTTPFRFIWKDAKFPAVGPQALNLSTRGLVGSGDNVLIGGFIVSGTAPKTIVLRALGPSLSGFGLSGVLRDPVLSVYDSSGNLSEAMTTGSPM